MRLFFAVLAAAAALGASFVSAAATPTYTVTFTGTGSEHQVDQKQNIEDDGTCNAAEHVDVTATLAWSSSWLGFTAAGRSRVGRPAQIAGSRIVGTHVKDACGLPLTDAPDGWVSQQSCDAELVATGSPQLSLVKKTAANLVLAIAAPPVAVPVSVQCPLNVRNDQLAVHVVVSLRQLRALKKGKSVNFTVGTVRPGPTDVYAPALDCSQPTKPYLGYRTADHCQDTLSWSGTVSITRRA